ncbi:hypothetical protein Pth03_08210 [Planotetraspora thailandica]|uniref:Uncharacterized protein n=1 Tax=Planotetraspora thailandica TaxID=487172 RepID=A0A8J3XRU2_9ACTN|nr:hypothetical protein [Planotetraspora thailandica]GII52432.1 hypothetical protein Pth03_08210 [Planotetraspora thailandica]
MPSRTRHKAAWAVVVLLLAVGGAVLLVPRLSKPDLAGTAREQVVTVDPPTRTVLMEAADHFLETDPGRNEHNFLAAEKPDLRPRVFCREELIEVRRKDPQLLVGLMAWCEELARSGGTLTLGSGYAVPLLLTMESVGGRYAVRDVEEPLDGEANIPTTRAMFSPEGAPRAIELASAGSDMKGVRAEARKAFGLPPDAPIS